MGDGSAKLAPPSLASNLSKRARELAPSRVEAFIRSVLPLVIGLTVALVLHCYAERWFGAYPQKILIDIGINIVLAVSLNIVNGYTGQFSIGHAGFMALGGYAAGYVMYYGSFYFWGDPNTFHGGFLSLTLDPSRYVGPYFGWGDLLFVGAMIAGGLVAAFFGLLVGLPSLRLRGDYLAIVTLGFGEIVRVIIESTRPVIDRPQKLTALRWYELFNHVGGPLGFTLPFYSSLFWVGTAVTVMLLVAYRIKNSTFGRAFLAIRENEIAAAAIGVPTTRYKVRAFVIAAFFAGVAGALFAHQVGNLLNPGELGFQKSFDIVIMVVLGGMGSISGAVLAAAVLTILPEALRQFADYRMVIYAAMLIVIMIVRPQGLFGVREIWDLPIWSRWRARRHPGGQP
ncbi:MAG: branched-chain amino acid ABC transporter permease [Phycisphaeraceae bacterium]|nr:branched-chain amino acid ABC transporter permease [Phycisphaeraceae bacterium]